LLSSYGVFPIQDFEAIVRWLIVFVARWSVFLGLDSSGLETLLFDMAQGVRLVGADPKDKKAKLGEIKDRLRKAAPSDEQIESAIERLILPAESAEYVIRTLSNSMESRTKETVTGRESNLEHIYPQNPDEGAWGGEENQALLEPYTWHLGNLTMLGERLNTKAKNAEYTIKAPKYASSELVMAREISELYGKWDRSSIEDRAKRLSPRLKKIWNFDNPSRV
jgi:hypothetical protein